jgi:Nif-specific regulatory protein
MTQEAAARARSYLLAGDPALALGACEAVLAEAEPADALSLRLTAARAAGELGDLAAQVTHLEAAERLARAAKLDVLGSVLGQLGDAHLRRNEPARAAVALEEALANTDADDSARTRREEALEEARRREEEVDDEGSLADDAPQAAGGSPAALAAADSRAAERLYAMIDRLLESDPDHDLNRVLDVVLAELVQAVGADRGFLLLKAPGEALVVRAARDARGRPVPQPAKQVSRKIAERAASESRAMRAVRPAEDPRFAGSRSAKALDLRAVVAAPLRYRRVAMGSVVLDRRGQKDSEKLPFSDSEEALVARFAKLATGVIVRTRRRDAEQQRARTMQDLFSRAAEHLEEEGFEVCGFVGKSEAAYQLLRFLEKVAPTDASILIRGESGSGKEMVARILHSNSPRRRARFEAVNCGALAESLLESELFGHVKGAFTGADTARPGIFERASGGTVFLDEIGDASSHLQAELLRVLQEGEVRRVGDQDVRRVDVRVLAATHQDLEEMVAEGRFREDLFYRLNMIQVSVPALRDRAQDIPDLARRFVEEAKSIMRDPSAARPLDDETLQAFQEREWRGNIRELRNAVLRHVAVGDLATDVPAPDVGAPRDGEILPLAELERRTIVAALRATGGAKNEAAKLLEISRRTLYNKIRHYGLE